MTLPAIVILSQQFYFCTLWSKIRFTAFVLAFQNLYIQICTGFCITFYILMFIELFYLIYLDVNITYSYGIKIKWSYFIPKESKLPREGNCSPDKFKPVIIVYTFYCAPTSSSDLNTEQHKKPHYKLWPKPSCPL